MSDAISNCNRCSEPAGDRAFAVELEKELLESVPRQLQLCPRCVESFERWYLKRGKSSSRQGPRPSTRGRSASPGMFAAHESRRRQRSLKRIQQFLMFGSVTVLVFVVVFYWTWTVLSRATRIEE